MTAVDSSARYPRADLWLVAALAAAAALPRLLAASLRGDYLSFDESMYIVLGRNLLAGRGYVMNDLPNATFPPLISLIAGLSDAAFGPRWALSLPSALLGAAGVVPLFLLARRMASRTVAFAAAILYAGFPSLLHFTPFVSYGRRLYDGSEQVYLFFFLFAAYFTYAAARDARLRDHLLAGLFAGAAFEVRQDAALFAAAALPWLAVIAVRRRSWRRLPLIAAFAAAALLAALPFLLQVRLITGSWGAGPRFAKTFSMRDTFTPVLAENRWEGALDSYFTLNDEGTRFETAYWGVSDWHRPRIAEGREAPRAIDVLAALRPANVAAAARAFFRFVVPDKLGYAVALGLIALLLSQWRRTNLSFLIVVMLPGAFAVAALFPLLRFVMYLAPFAVLLVAWGVAAAFSAAALIAPRLKRAAAPAAIAATAVLALYGTRSALRAQTALRAERTYERVAEDLYVKAAGWLAGNTSTGARVMASSPQAPLLARRAWLALPVDSPSRVLPYARLRAADHMLITSSGDDEPPAQLAPSLAAAFAGEARGVPMRVSIYDLSTVPAGPPGDRP